MVDGRRERGDRTRRAVAARAAALASVDGLAGMSIAQIADALGVSKSSIQAAYKTKEELQLGAIAAATEIFVEAVVAPGRDEPEGLPRLQSYIDSWLAYVEQRVFPGGCFMVATLTEFDSRPGPVRDALARARQGWLGLLERQIDIAQAAGDLADSPSASMLAFEIDALLSSANVSRNLSDETTPLEVARALLAIRLGTPSQPTRGRGRMRT
jgi:AcrR family transcriptional regulator